MAGTSWKRGQKRPSISEQIKRELWARTAGRCEFRGCNELLYRDSLTQNRSNLATISHIIAYSPRGPRGHEIRSAKLARDISNLMLTCKKHGNMVDDLNLVEKYSVELLREFKTEHEERVRIVTGIQADAQSHVLLIQAPVDGRDFSIDERRVYDALFPKYPAEEHAAVIDLSAIGVAANSPGFYDITVAVLTDQTSTLLRRRAGQRRVKNLAVFAVAPIPLLVYFGRLIGDLQAVDLFQCHRAPRGWKWPLEEEAGVFYDIEVPDMTNCSDLGASEEVEEHLPIVLVLAVSAPVRRELVETALGVRPLVYELKAQDPGRDFLMSQKRLELFGYEFRKLLDLLRERHGHEQIIHLFAAVPAPVAIEVGRNMKDVDPPFTVYDYQKRAGGYTAAFTLNTRDL